MAKGKIMKEDAQWSDYPGVKDGAVLMLMGTAEGNELKPNMKNIMDPSISLNLVRQISSISYGSSNIKANEEENGAPVEGGDVNNPDDHEFW